MVKKGEKAVSKLSPPSRAAWIEIYAEVAAMVDNYVAAFTGGVD